MDLVVGSKGPTEPSNREYDGSRDHHQQTEPVTLIML